MSTEAKEMSPERLAKRTVTATELQDGATLELLGHITHQQQEIERLMNDAEEHRARVLLQNIEWNDELGHTEAQIAALESQLATLRELLHSIGLAYGGDFTEATRQQIAVAVADPARKASDG